VILLATLLFNRIVVPTFILCREGPLEIIWFQKNNRLRKSIPLMLLKQILVIQMHGVLEIKQVVKGLGMFVIRFLVVFVSWTLCPSLALSHWRKQGVKVYYSLTRLGRATCWVDWSLDINKIFTIWLEETKKQQPFLPLLGKLGCDLLHVLPYHPKGCSSHFNNVYALLITKGVVYQLED